MRLMILFTAAKVYGSRRASSRAASSLRKSTRGGLLLSFPSVAVQSAWGTVNWLNTVVSQPIFCIPDWNALAMFMLYGSLLLTMAFVFDEGTHCFVAVRFFSSTTNPGPYQGSDGSPLKMLVIPRCCTKSTF